MPSANELLKQGRTEEVWQKCCGFIDLSLSEFMEIQYRLLMEQIESLNTCELGRKVMGGIKPKTIEEFQKGIPPTTYEDYAEFLLEQREDTLPEKPITWQRTSGRSGEYPFKWVPLSERMYEELGDTMLGIMIFCACKGTFPCRNMTRAYITWLPDRTEPGSGLSGHRRCSHLISFRPSKKPNRCHSRNAPKKDSKWLYPKE